MKRTILAYSKLKSILIAFVFIFLANNIYSQKNDTLQFVIDLISSDDYYWYYINRDLKEFDTIYFEYENIEKDTFIDVVHYIRTLSLDTVSIDVYNNLNLESVIFSSSNTDNILIIEDKIIIDTIYNVFNITKKAPKTDYYNNYINYLRPEYQHNIPYGREWSRVGRPFFYSYTYFNNRNNVDYLSVVLSRFPPNGCGNNYIRAIVFNIEEDSYNYIDELDFETFYKFSRQIKGKDTVLNISTYDNLISDIIEEVRYLRFNSYSQRPYMPDTIFFNSPYYNIDTVFGIDEIHDLILTNDTLHIPTINRVKLYNEYRHIWGLCDVENDSCFTISLKCTVKMFSDLELHEKLLKESLLVDKKYLDYYYLRIYQYRDPNIIGAECYPYKLHYTTFAY